MKTNVGIKDKAIRIIIALILLILVGFDQINGTTAIIACFVSAILSTTSFIGFCPLYRIFGMSTNCLSCNTDDKTTEQTSEEK